LGIIELLVGEEHPEQDPVKIEILKRILWRELHREESYLGTIRQIFLYPDEKRKTV